MDVLREALKGAVRLRQHRLLIEDYGDYAVELLTRLPQLGDWGRQDREGRFPKLMGFLFPLSSDDMLERLDAVNQCIDETGLGEEGLLIDGILLSILMSLGGRDGGSAAFVDAITEMTERVPHSEQVGEIARMDMVAKIRMHTLVMKIGEGVEDGEFIERLRRLVVDTVIHRILHTEGWAPRALCEMHEAKKDMLRMHHEAVSNRRPEEERIVGLLHLVRLALGEHPEGQPVFMLPSSDDVEKKGELADAEVEERYVRDNMSNMTPCHRLLAEKVVGDLDGMIEVLFGVNSEGQFKFMTAS